MKRNILVAALLALSLGTSFAASHSGAPMAGATKPARAPADRAQACAVASPGMKKTLECSTTPIAAPALLGPKKQASQGMTAKKKQKRANGKTMQSAKKAKPAAPAVKAPAVLTPKAP